MQGHNDDVTGLAFSSDGSALATACEDKCIRVYKMQDLKAKNISSIKHQMTAVPIDVAFGVTSHQVATTTRGKLHDQNLVPYTTAILIAFLCCTLRCAAALYVAVQLTLPYVILNIHVHS